LDSFARLFAPLNGGFRRHRKQLRDLNPSGWSGVTQAAVRIHELATPAAEWRSQALANSLVTHGVSQLLGAAGATWETSGISDALG